ncbi:DUF418 domain-containing protein [Nocardiopsis sp. NRRL B-16309]|uniref:DUF418 domain-containing protein n=1 Tax=Nocardiopsis sp. NRRL B-16309 TaxID=1519494 RepID=UPI0006B06200|nr:DUF418 domain-containing protein [Nocardiopsis sp. NRRL B-16309]KOX12427.1 hypothetical protein ADL05_21270 [Nocardiopsis sp. NRRL B-16309]
MPSPKSTAVSAVAREPSPRALVPDLARGYMLLLIALAHAPLFVTVATGSVPDRAVNILLSLFVDHRARPLFALLFGYALVQITERAAARDGTDWPRARGLIRRRGAWMVAFGLAHTLVFVDIIGVYGLIALLGAGVLRWSDRALLWGAAALVVPAAAVGWIVSAGELSGQIDVITASVTMADPWSAAVHRFRTLPVETLGRVLTVLPAVLAGVWAARRRVLEEPARHRRLLTATAAAGLGTAVVGGLPAALAHAGAWHAPSPLAAQVLAAVHLPTGLGAGVGLAALVALAASGPRPPHGPVTAALVALGQRSMTFYVAQSFVFVGLLSPFALGLGASLTAPSACALALAVWAGSAVAADLMRRGGVRGPFESLLRRLVHGRRRD